MGWLAVYTAVFMVMTMAMVDFRAERRVDADYYEATALGAQMQSWHSAAATKCGSAGACPAGPIDPTANMDQILIAGGAYGRNNFHTLTDGQHIIATYYYATNGNRSWQGM